jgi:hypothetical protein
MPIQRDRRLTEIGRYCGTFNEFVIDRTGLLPVLTAGIAEISHLPWPLPGAIIGPDKRRRRMTFGSGEIDPSQSPGGGSPTLRTPAPANQVTFSRRELNRILDLYGRKVAAGEWRDYAIDFLKDRAVFSVFRRASEVPLYRIEKNPKLSRRQGAYSVISATGLIVRRGHELDRVLRAIDPLSLVAN